MATEAVFKPNPNLAEQLMASVQMEHALETVAREVAANAEEIAAGHQYTTEVHVELGRAEVRARTHRGEGVESIAGWLEFGADGPRHILALAPLRNGAQRAGLKVQGR